MTGDEILMPVIEDLKKKQPRRNIVFVAIDELEDPEQVKAFYSEYVELVGKETAEQNIGYVLGYYSDEMQAFWKSILGDKVEHPFVKNAIKYKFPKEV